MDDPRLVYRLKSRGSGGIRSNVVRPTIDAAGLGAFDAAVAMAASWQRFESPPGGSTNWPIRGAGSGQQVGADTTAKYGGFECADGYYEGIDMAIALHPQWLMAFKPADAIRPIRYGYPFRILVSTKLGFKNAKFVTTIYVTNQRPNGFWTDRGYTWFSGI